MKKRRKKIFLTTTASINPAISERARHGENPIAASSTSIQSLRSKQDSLKKSLESKMETPTPKVEYPKVETPKMPLQQVGQKPSSTGLPPRTATPKPQLQQQRPSSVPPQTSTPKVHLQKQIPRSIPAKTELSPKSAVNPQLASVPKPSLNNVPIAPPRTVEEMRAFLMANAKARISSDIDEITIELAAKVFIDEKVDFERIKNLKSPFSIKALRVDVEREKRNREAQSHEKGYGYER